MVLPGMRQVCIGNSGTARGNMNKYAQNMAWLKKLLKDLKEQDGIEPEQE